jgi:hypothetical protein
MTTAIIYVRNQIIARAMRLAQVSSDMDVMDDQKLLHAGEALACLLRAWQEKKINLWTEEWLTATLTASSTVLATDGKYYRCIKGHTSTPTDEPGVGSQWTTYWFEDSSVTGAAWATTTAYTCAAEISSPTSYDILAAFIRDGVNEYDLLQNDQVGFFQTFDVQTLSTPTQFWFDKKNQVIHLSYIPDKTTYVLHFLSIRTLDNLLADGQPPDIPSSYQDALVYCLAANLADEAGIPLERCQYLRANGERYLQQVMSGPFQDKRKPQGIKSMYPRFK